MIGTFLLSSIYFLPKTLYSYKIDGESIGEILLSIEYEDDKAFVQLTYFDTAGGKIRKSELAAIADNDL